MVSTAEMPADREATILENCRTALDQLEVTISSFRQKLAPLHSSLSVIDTKPVENEARNQLHDIELRIRKLTSELVELMNHTEL